MLLLRARAGAQTTPGGHSNAAHPASSTNASNSHQQSSVASPLAQSCQLRVSADLISPPPSHAHCQPELNYPDMNQNASADYHNQAPQNTYYQQQPYGGALVEHEPVNCAPLTYYAGDRLPPSGRADLAAGLMEASQPQQVEQSGVQTIVFPQQAAPYEDIGYGTV